MLIPMAITSLQCASYNASKPGVSPLGELMGRAANHAVQIHGGYGLMKDYGVERFYRDQKLLDIGEGTSEVQRMVISRYIGC